MNEASNEARRAIRHSIREVCERFPSAYWRELDRSGSYPDELVRTLPEPGDASLPAAPARGYPMAPPLPHGSEALKRRYPPDIAGGKLRLQAFGLTEPDAGSDSTRIKTTAVRRGDRYVITGQKVFTPRVLQS